MYPTKNSPCRFCRRRSPGCHARCDSYSAYDADNQQRRKESRMASIADESAITRGYRFWRDTKNGKKVGV